MLSLEFPFVFEIDSFRCKGLCTPGEISERLFILTLHYEISNKYSVSYFHIAVQHMNSMSLYYCSIQNCVEYNQSPSSGVRGHIICTSHWVHSVNS